MNVYTIDFDKLIVHMQMTFLRKPIAFAFTKCVVAPIVSLYVSFLMFRKDSLYKIGHNSQVVYLRAALNDSFDSSLRRITISNAEVKPATWFYEIEENKPIYFREIVDLEPVYFREDSEFLGGAFDFIVNVPMDLKPSDPQALQAFIIKMSALVDYYKLYSKSYSIEFITL